jgi:GDPmannose 4,6-dehydratase
MGQKRALITGITGQDGYYLSQLLLEKGYEVHGLYRRTSSSTAWRLKEISDHIHMHLGDLTDMSSLLQVLATVQPDEVYNLAAQSSAAASFNTAASTADINAIGPSRLLDALNVLGLRETRFFQASTAELFGKPPSSPQSETTPFSPRTPYGCAKLYAHWTTVHHREVHGRFAVNGILYNHESPLRGEEFVTRKISRQAVEVCLGLRERVLLGNLSGCRDWSHASDITAAMWRMLQAPTPQDFVVGSGQARTVRDFAAVAFAAAGTTLEWCGQGVDEIGRCTSTGHVMVAVDPGFYRPAEAENMCADISAIKNTLYWQPKIAFEDLVAEMVRHDFDGLAVSALRATAGVMRSALPTGKTGKAPTRRKRA